MKVISLDTFLSFKKFGDNDMMLFGKKIKNHIKKSKTIKKNFSYLNLTLNKVNNTNYLIHLKNFLKTYYIENNQFSNITLEFYVKMISDDNFMESYLLFYKELLEAYYKKSKFDFTYFINLVESKFLMDFENKKVLLGNMINSKINIPDDITEEKKLNYINTYKTNNIKLIYFLIKHDILDDKIIQNILYPILSQEENLQYLYELLVLNKDYDYLSKLNFNNYNLRFKTLFKELLNSKNNIPSKNSNINKTTKNNKNNNKNLIENIIEEYLFMDEIDEVKTFIENHILKKNLQVKFVEISLSYGKSHNKEKEIKGMLEQVSHILKKKPVNLQYL